jgi:hypothetical protein
LDFTLLSLTVPDSLNQLDKYYRIPAIRPDASRTSSENRAATEHLLLCSRTVAVVINNAKLLPGQTKLSMAARLDPPASLLND